MKKKFPDFESDEEAERFVETADLSKYDFSEFKPMRFEKREPVAHIDIQVPQRLLEAVHDKAAARGVSDAHYIRELLERDVEGAQ